MGESDPSSDQALDYLPAETGRRPASAADVVLASILLLAGGLFAAMAILQATAALLVPGYFEKLGAATIGVSTLVMAGVAIFAVRRAIKLLRNRPGG